MTEAEVSKKKKKKTEDSTEKELSLDELREKLARKELEEKLKEKHVDTSLIGVCQTCHVPIYHGEAVYTPHDYKTAGEHSGEYGEASHGPGFTNPGTTYTGGGYQGRDKRYSVSEGWIQCGWCYKQYHKELESVKVWEKRLWMWGLLCIPFGAVGFGLGYSKILDLYGWMGKPDAPPLYSAIWIGIGFLVLGSVAGFLINWLKHGSKPVPDRYKLRENPNREKQ